ncbi:MAG TPA: hypothetical protein VGT61_16665 [Thermomicrobiales bacterium]|jgi:hypothetical protein|nr:hypothetical protein [Thermomicrobiales bacterium]
MNTHERLRVEEERLAEAFPSWECRAVADAGTGENGPFVVRCRKVLSSRPIDVTEGGDDESLTFTGANWDEAFNNAETGLLPGDQGEPDFL